MDINKCKAKDNKCDPSMADKALARAKGDRKGAYSEYVRLTYEKDGTLNCGCDNKNLQNYYENK